MRLISDVHGKIQQYLDIVKDQEYSLQLGDMGFDYSLLRKLNYDKHKFIPGNHDNYDNLPPHAYNSYGMESLGGIDFFYVRGAFSIDWLPRVSSYIGRGVKSWFEQEQLSQEELRLAIQEYVYHKPEIVISHDFPLTISRKIGNHNVVRSFGYDPNGCLSRTQLALEVMFLEHQPKKWFGAHYHVDVDFKFKNTNFVCMRELRYIDV